MGGVAEKVLVRIPAGGEPRYFRMPTIKLVSEDLVQLVAPPPDVAWKFTPHFGDAGGRQGSHLCAPGMAAVAATWQAARAGALRAADDARVEPAD